MVKVAIMGFGTVGSGVLEVLRTSSASVARRAGQEVEVKYILDKRDFSSHRDAKMFVQNLDVILSDDEVKVVVEAMGGVQFAYPFVKQCLESGRSVCTSNKELVATHGAELMAIAKEKHCAFLFEASVGGGMPLITPMHQCLAANNISEIYGIVNGTTNFMLTKMKNENMSFADALKMAQELGYAETKDPSDDVDGLDAQRKIAILSSMVSGSQVHTQNIPAKGIRDIAVVDIEMAERLNATIKLIAWMKKDEEGKLAVGVEPMMVPKENQLSNVSDVYNAVLLLGDMLGDVLFYGRGAGKLPTASAVVADVIDAIKSGSDIHDSLFWAQTLPAEGMLTASERTNYYLRVKGVSHESAQALFGVAHVIKSSGGETMVCVPNAMAEEITTYESKLQEIGGGIALKLKFLK